MVSLGMLRVEDSNKCPHEIRLIRDQACMMLLLMHDYDDSEAHGGQVVNDRSTIRRPSEA
jgi:hypothetical protein